MGMSENLLLQKGVIVKIVMLRKQGPQKRTQESVGLEGPGSRALWCQTESILKYL